MEIKAYDVNSSEYIEYKKNHPNAKECSYNAETGQLIFKERNGLSTTSSSIFIPQNEEKTENNSAKADQQNLLQADISKGFLTEKKNFLDGEYYIFDVKKYEEATGKTITLGEIKQKYGLENGTLRVVNDIGFKDHHQGELRDYDSAKIEDVLPSKKLKIPKGSMYQTDSWSQKEY